MITLWEALLTVLQYGLLLLHAYAQDKRWPYVSIPLYGPNLLNNRSFYLIYFLWPCTN